MNEPILARSTLTLALPAVTTSTVLILARIWNANGAEHSIGNAALMTVLAAGSGAAGAFLARAGDGPLAAAAFAISGGLALTGVAGYADGISLPLLLWALATVVAYCFAARLWRADRLATLTHQRQTAMRREEHAHVERVEALRAGAQIEVARSGAAYAESLATALIARATLPGFDPRALESAGLPELPSTYGNQETQ